MLLSFKIHRNGGFFFINCYFSNKKIMSVKKTTIEGTKIICEIESSNLKTTEYDTESKKLVVEFKNGFKYEYDEVPHNIYAQFRLSESQGKFFNASISKTYKYKKLDK